ncbi:MAG: flippase [Candidatus Hydrogenedentes bacterium]|nr:flippase [Candidatus Hydrogenedentota bacterium]
MTGVRPPQTGMAATATKIGLNLVSLVASRFVALALTLVQMAIIFRVMDVEARGVFGFSMQFTSLFTVFATLGIQRLLVRDIARDPTLAWTHVWTAFFVVVALSGAVMLAIAASALYVEHSAPNRLSMLFAGGWVVLLWAWQRPFEGLLIARERMDLVSIVTVTASVLKIGTVYCLIRLSATSASAHAAIFIATGASFLLCVWFAFRVCGWARPQFQWALALQQVRECYPFAVAMLCSLVYFKSDMSLLKFLRGDLEAGIYTPPQRVMEPLLMIAGLWGTAVFPALCRFSHTSPEDYTAVRKTSLRFALLAAVPMAFGLALTAKPVIDILTGSDPEAQGSVFVLKVLAAMTPFFYLNGIAQEFFYAIHRNWFVVIAYAAGAACNVAGNLFAIPAYGATGAAVVAVFTNAFISGFFILGLRGAFGGMHLPTLVSKSLLACGAMSLVFLAAAPFSLILGISVGAVAYLALLLLLRTFEPAERDLMRAMGAAVWRRRG